MHGEKIKIKDEDTQKSKCEHWSHTVCVGSTTVTTKIRGSNKWKAKPYSNNKNLPLSGILK